METFNEWLKKKNNEWQKEVQQNQENYIDLPLVIDKNYLGKVVKKAKVGTEEYIDNVEFSLHMAVCSRTGQVSIQYVGEDDSFLSKKEIIKALKIENKIGKHKYE
jgi:hypothetical protein